MVGTAGRLVQRLRLLHTNASDIFGAADTDATGVPAVALSGSSRSSSSGGGGKWRVWELVVACLGLG
jgi:hypothetical protein